MISSVRKKLTEDCHINQVTEINRTSKTMKEIN